jgi:SAM-dependent methyltransferase
MLSLFLTVTILQITKIQAMDFWIKVHSQIPFWGAFDGNNESNYHVNSIPLFEWLDLMTNTQKVNGDRIKILEIGCSKGEVAKQIYDHFNKYSKVNVLAITGGLESKEILIQDKNGNSFQILNQIPIEFLVKKFQFNDFEKNAMRLKEMDPENIEKKIQQIINFQPNLVICFGTLIHMNDNPNFVKNIYELLTEEGILVANISYHSQKFPNTFDYFHKKSDLSVMVLGESSGRPVILAQKTKHEPKKQNNSEYFYVDHLWKNKRNEHFQESIIQSFLENTKEKFDEDFVKQQNLTDDFFKIWNLEIKFSNIVDDKHLIEKNLSRKWS